MNLFGVFNVFLWVIVMFHGESTWPVRVMALLMVLGFIYLGTGSLID